MMLETFQKKVEGLAEDYADLIRVRIMDAQNIMHSNEAHDNDFNAGTGMETIYEGIRILNHLSSVLERIDRIQRRNACGQNLSD